MNKPTTGTLYSRPCNDGITALVIDVIRPLDGGWLCLALLLSDAADWQLTIQQIVLTAGDTLVYMRDTVSVVHHLAALRQQQIEREMTVKEAQRAERLVDLYMRQATFAVRWLLAPAKAPVDETPAERMEMERLGLASASLRKHPGGRETWGMW